MIVCSRSINAILIEMQTTPGAFDELPESKLLTQ